MARPNTDQGTVKRSAVRQSEGMAEHEKAKSKGQNWVKHRVGHNQAKHDVRRGRARSNTWPGRARDVLGLVTMARRKMHPGQGR